MIVKAKPFVLFQQKGVALWYVLEMKARAAYYRKRIAQETRFRCIEATAPELREPEFTGRLLEEVSGRAVCGPVKIPKPQNTTPAAQWHVPPAARHEFDRAWSVACGAIQQTSGVPIMTLAIDWPAQAPESLRASSASAALGRTLCCVLVERS